MTFNQIELSLQKAKAKKEYIAQSIQEKEKKLKLLKRKIKHIEEAQLILQTVARQTQEQLQFQVSEIVTLALQAVFEKKYEFKMQFVTKREKTEAELFLLLDGEEYDPMYDTGGGVVDIVTFALRIAVYKLSIPQRRNTILLDEPFSRLRGAKVRECTGAMLHELSKKLNIQFIIVSHEDVVINNADRTFKVTQGKSGVSQCVQLN